MLAYCRTGMRAVTLDALANVDGLWRWEDRITPLPKLPDIDLFFRRMPSEIGSSGD